MIGFRIARGEEVEEYYPHVASSQYRLTKDNIKYAIGEAADLLVAQLQNYVDEINIQSLDYQDKVELIFNGATIRYFLVEIEPEPAVTGEDTSVPPVPYPE
ncbi:hypothetical protein C8R30_101153 [Nitrosomonas nitrosa]|uniref:hypothetical protein n=1 Tax=Nitrosomonas nitrosa TaxID=52442 RepID=UPI000D30B35D|nr:hypothetical protein [Nitrosomonas nitrosa]PTR04956.1 hypothetical protein C8R30_101153 [Nitrosomonas nitrosa]